MNAQTRLVRRVGIVIAIVAVLAAAAGCSLVRSSSETSTESPGAQGGTVGYGTVAVSPVAPSEADRAVVAPSDSKSAETVAPDRMIVSTASMNIEVEDIDKSVAVVRSIATGSGSEIADLSIQTGDGGGGGPVPLGAESASSDRPSSSAQVTLRVPADKLASVEAKAAKLGKVLSQSRAQSDVTQQYVDLAARLKNLQAEEIRLRGFLNQATKVSEMLEVERELSRVRGEIEAMQAQIGYLEQQAAMATLTLALSAPGALVQPSGGTWGFSAAVTAGVQAAATVLRTLITMTIALLPVVLVVLVIILVWRSWRRRRLATASARAEAAADAAPVQVDPDVPAK